MTEEKLGYLERFMHDIKEYARGDKRQNERGNTVYSAFIGSRDRLQFDTGPCDYKKDWQQYDTHQDAWYFGVWVHIEKRMTVTYAEGDLTVVTCPTLESFRAEIESMNEFYGDPPPWAIALDVENGTKTHYIQERPKV